MQAVAGATRGPTPWEMQASDGRARAMETRRLFRGALVHRSGLPHQFVEQVVCVLRGERPEARTLRGGREGYMGSPWARGRRCSGGGEGGGAMAAAEADGEHLRGGREARTASARHDLGAALRSWVFSQKSPGCELPQEVSGS